MKLSGFAALWLEAEDVLAMHLFPYQLNGLLQGVFLQETQGAAAGGMGEQAGKIRLVQAIQFAKTVNQTTRPQVWRHRRVVGSRTEGTLLHLDSFRLGLQILGGLWLYRVRFEEWRISQPIYRGIEPLYPLHDFRQLRNAATVPPLRNHDDDSPPRHRPPFQHDERVVHGVQNPRVAAFHAQHAERVNHLIQIGRAHV